MTAARKHPLRVFVRLCWLTGEILLAAARCFLECPPGFKTGKTAARARWLQRSSRRVLRVFGAQVEHRGAAPAEGLLVCNHLGYLDILVISSLWPAVFVAKMDVRGWAVLGWLAALAGTIFIDRERRSHVGEINRDISRVLDTGALVVLFPEGTSSGGDTVLSFKSSLLEPAVQSAHPLTAALIEYELEDGDVSEEVCYWKDMTLVPHLVNLLGRRALWARLSSVPVKQPANNRKELARQLHAEVLRLKGPDPGRLLDESVVRSVARQTKLIPDVAGVA